MSRARRVALEDWADAYARHQDGPGLPRRAAVAFSAGTGARIPIWVMPPGGSPEHLVVVAGIEHHEDLWQLLPRCQV